MSELDLDAIEARAARHEARYPWRYTEQSKDFLARDRKALVAYVRELEAAVERVRELHTRTPRRSIAECSCGLIICRTLHALEGATE